MAEIKWPYWGCNPYIYISGVKIPLIIGRGWIPREDDLFGTDYIDDLCVQHIIYFQVTPIYFLKFIEHMETFLNINTIFAPPCLESIWTSKHKG